MADDRVWEGPESLTVELELSRDSLGAELVEEMSRAEVIIDDSEDSKQLGKRKAMIMM